MADFSMDKIFVFHNHPPQSLALGSKLGNPLLLRRDHISELGYTDVREING